MRAPRPRTPFFLSIILRIGSILLIAATAACSSQPDGGFRIVDGQIVTDVFDVTARLDPDGRLTMELDTDLGDSTVLMVSVSRSYVETDDDSEHVIDYFSEPGTVGEWRTPRTIAVSDEEWGRRLEEQQRSMEDIGLGFTVERIADDIEVSFVVPIEQDPPFEEGNSNLTGSVVYGTPLRNVRDDVVVQLPYTGELPAPRTP